MTRPIPSDAEIAVLEAIAAEGAALKAHSTHGGQAVSVRLRHVDPKHRFLFITAGEGQLSPASLPPNHAVLFESMLAEWRIAFSAAHPEPAMHDGEPGIRLAFPAHVDISRRRSQVRASVPDGEELKLVAYSGAVPIFEARIVDVSRGGFGIQLGGEGASLQPGTVLGGCRVERNDGTSVVIDVEVRHTSQSNPEDGETTYRAGCRFVQLSPEAERLVEEYLGEHPPGS